MELTPDIIKVKALDRYNIYLKFENGEEKIYDMTEHINKIKYFSKLKNREYFEKITIRGDTIEWASGEDVAPEKLYYESIQISEYNGKMD